jgi:hypothetical protein
MKRFIFCFALALIAGPAFGAVPQTMSYQGVVTDLAGNVVPDGPHNFVFTIYDDPVAGVPGILGGNTLWTENQVLTTKLGGFGTNLGNSSPLNLGFDKKYYLGICVDPPGFPAAPYPAGTEISPRVELGSSPYCLTAQKVLETFAHTGTAATTTIGAAWTNYSGGSVTIVAPGPGYVVVDSDFWLRINHANGTLDQASIGIATTPIAVPSASGMWTMDVPAAFPTVAGYDISGHVRYVFSVGAGSQTYYLNGQMVSGQDAADVFWFANMNAIYYFNPSPTVAPPEPGMTMQEKLAQMNAAATTSRK